MNKQQWLKENQLFLKTRLKNSPILQAKFSQYIQDLQDNLEQLKQVDGDRWKQKTLTCFTNSSRVSWPIACEWNIREIIFDIDADITLIMEHPEVDYFKSPNLQFSYEELQDILPED